MINFIDEKGVKHSAIVECKKTKGVNGEKSLSGTIYTNDKILEGIGRGWRLEFENEKYCLTYVYPIDEGNRIVVEFDAVHEFFFDLNKKVVYTELNGSNTAKAYLDIIFNGSGYSYLIEVNIPAFEKEGFGMRNRLDLFKEFISDTGVEFSVNGKVVRILEKVGSNLSTIVKKGFNLNELRIEKDPGSFITYKKGFGAWHDDDDHSKGRLEVEYLSPLASIYGKLEGDPIVDERYKVASNFETRLKNDVESSYGISVDIDMEDLTKAGYEYEQPHEGDYIMAINKDLGFEQKIRIMSYETSYDTNGNIIDHKVACGSDNIIRKSTKEDDDFRKEIQAGLEGAISTSNKAWVSANGKNAVFEGPDEPTATAIGDIWWQIDGEEKKMRIWNGYEWKPVFNPGEIENKIDQAEKDIAQNIINIDSALDKATQAELDAGFATDLAKDASTLANQTAASLVSVKVTADNAKINADNAILDAQNALNKAIKSSVIHYALSANGTTPPATGWQTSNPNPTADQYVWTRTTITLNDNSPIVSYSVGKIGSKGDKGDKGDTGGQGIQGVPGVNAPTITSVVQQFYLSTSKTTQTGGSWLSTVPIWSSGKYYWVRVATTYSNGATTTSTPVLDNALNDSLVTALEVKTANQNLSTTVTQHATLIEGKASSTTVDAIAGRVTTAEGSISTIAGKVELKANSTDVQTLTGRVTTAEGKITTQAGQIALKANTTDVNTLTGRVTTAEGNITTQGGLIALKANQSVVDTLTGRVSTTEAKITATDGKVTTLTIKTDGNTTSIGQLQTSYSGLSSTVTQVKNNLEGMEIGGRNLIVTTESLDGYSYKTSDKYLNFNIARTTKGATGYADTFSATTIDVAEGVKYTASFFARTSVASVIMCYWYYPNTTIHAISSTGQVTYGLDEGVLVTTSTDWKRYWVTWTQSTTTAVKHLIIGRNHLTPEGTIVEIAGVKLEKGNKATDWSPAPEDYTTVVAFSALEQNLSGFKTTVANTYADKTTVSQLATQWQTTTELANGHTTQITSMGTAINLRATKTEVAGSLGAVNLITNGGNIQSTAGWSGTVEISKHPYYKSNTANLLTLITAGTSEVTASGEYFNIEPNTEYTLTFYGFASSNVRSMDVHFLSRKNTSSNGYDNAKLLLSTNLSSGQLDRRSVTFTTNATDNQAYIRFDNNGSTNGAWSGLYVGDITLVKGSVAPRAWFESTADSIVSQINISPESILLSSKKIQIKGDTYIESGVIKTAHIADLAVSGAKIANATISSAKIVSLDASKINVGTLTGHTISGAIINGGSITGTTFHNEGADGNVTIANGRIRAKDFFVRENGALVSETGYIVI
ncbi:phage tail protein, partial [Jeotgalibaca porci]